MPPPLLTFEGVGEAQRRVRLRAAGQRWRCRSKSLRRSDHSSFKVFDKNGNTLAGPTTYNSLFAPLTGTPCGASQNDGDPYALYDPLAIAG